MFRPWQVRSGSKYAWILIVPAVLMGTVFAASTTRSTHGQSSPAAQKQMGTTCVYTEGPKAGSSHDYAPVQMPVNSACNDGAGSTGVIIPMGITQAQPMGTICKFTTGPKAGQTQDYAPMHAPLNTACKDGSGDAGVIIASPVKGETAVSGQMGTVCKFTSGPRAGATQDYTPMQAPVDMPCTDGSGSSGTIIATAEAADAPDTATTPDTATAPDTAAAPASSPTGTVCKFIAGPKAGTTHDYAPVHAPLDTPCDDGIGSSGVIVSTSATGTVCKFATGPKAGTTQDYAPIHEPLNTPCDDGAGSRGVIIPAPQTSSVCKFTEGPKAGTTHDYAPVHAPLNTACDDGAGSSGVIVAPTPTGTVCKFTTGPKAGTTRDYAPMHAPLNTTCDDGAGSSGVIVASAAKATEPVNAPPATTPAATAPGKPAPSNPPAPANAAAPVSSTPPSRAPQRAECRRERAQCLPGRPGFLLQTDFRAEGRDHLQFRSLEGGAWRAVQLWGRQGHYRGKCIQRCCTPTSRFAEGFAYRLQTYLRAKSGLLLWSHSGRARRAMQRWAWQRRSRCRALILRSRVKVDNPSGGRSDS